MSVSVHERERSATLCKYYMHGACRNGPSCPFSHTMADLPNLTCKYYLQGTCKFGASCRYDHVKPQWSARGAAAAASSQASHPAPRVLLPPPHTPSTSTPPAVASSSSAAAPSAHSQQNINSQQQQQHNAWEERGKLSFAPPGASCDVQGQLPAASRSQQGVSQSEPLNLPSDLHDEGDNVQGEGEACYWGGEGEEQQQYWGTEAEQQQYYWGEGGEQGYGSYGYGEGGEQGYYGQEEGQYYWEGEQCYGEGEQGEREREGEAEGEQGPDEERESAVPRVLADPDVNPAEIELCPWFTRHARCPKKSNCEFIHGTECEVCHLHAVHPYNEEKAREHLEVCTKRHAKLQSRLMSAEIECGICMEKVLSHSNPSERRFGLMACDHPFCLRCIRGWRERGTADVDTAVRTCPVCRTTCYFITPSGVWPTSPEEKQEIVEAYRTRLSTIDCSHFDQGEGTCPFGTSCFYRHAYPDGTLEQRDAPRRAMGADSSHVVGALRLSEFLGSSSNFDRLVSHARRNRGTRVIID